MGHHRQSFVRRAAIFGMIFLLLLLLIDAFAVVLAEAQGRELVVDSAGAYHLNATHRKLSTIGGGLTIPQEEGGSKYIDVIVDACSILRSSSLASASSSSSTSTDVGVSVNLSGIDFIGESSFLGVTIVGNNGTCSAAEGADGRGKHDVMLPIQIVVSDVFIHETGVLAFFGDMAHGTVIEISKVNVTAIGMSSYTAVASVHPLFADTYLGAYGSPHRTAAAVVVSWTGIYSGSFKISDSIITAICDQTGTRGTEGEINIRSIAVFVSPATNGQLRCSGLGQGFTIQNSVVTSIAKSTDDPVKGRRPTSTISHGVAMSGSWNIHLTNYAAIQMMGSVVDVSATETNGKAMAAVLHLMGTSFKCPFPLQQGNEPYACGVEGRVQLDDHAKVLQENCTVSSFCASNAHAGRSSLCASHILSIGTTSVNPNSGEKTAAWSVVLTGHSTIAQRSCRLISRSYSWASTGISTSNIMAIAVLSSMKPKIVVSFLLALSGGSSITQTNCSLQSYSTLVRRATTSSEDMMYAFSTSNIMALGVVASTTNEATVKMSLVVVGGSTVSQLSSQLIFSRSRMPYFHEDGYSTANVMAIGVVASTRRAASIGKLTANITNRSAIVQLMCDGLRVESSAARTGTSTAATTSSASGIMIIGGVLSSLSPARVDVVLFVSGNSTVTQKGLNITSTQVSAKKGSNNVVSSNVMLLAGISSVYNSGTLFLEMVLSDESSVTQTHNFIDASNVVGLSPTHAFVALNFMGIGVGCSGYTGFTMSVSVVVRRDSSIVQAHSSMLGNGTESIARWSYAAVTVMGVGVVVASYHGVTSIMAEVALTDSSTIAIHNSSILLRCVADEKESAIFAGVTLGGAGAYDGETTVKFSANILLAESSTILFSNNMVSVYVHSPQAKRFVLSIGTATIENDVHKSTISFTNGSLVFLRDTSIVSLTNSGSEAIVQFPTNSDVTFFRSMVVIDNISVASPGTLRFVESNGMTRVLGRSPVSGSAAALVIQNSISNNNKLVENAVWWLGPNPPDPPPPPPETPPSSSSLTFSNATIVVHCNTKRATVLYLENPSVVFSDVSPSWGLFLNSFRGASIIPCGGNKAGGGGEDRPVCDRDLSCFPPRSLDAVAVAVAGGLHSSKPEQCRCTCVPEDNHDEDDDELGDRKRRRETLSFQELPCGPFLAIPAAAVIMERSLGFSLPSLCGVLLLGNNDADVDCRNPGGNGGESGSGGGGSPTASASRSASASYQHPTKSLSLSAATHTFPPSASATPSRTSNSKIVSLQPSISVSDDEDGIHPATAEAKKKKKERQRTVTALVQMLFGEDNEKAADTAVAAGATSAVMTGVVTPGALSQVGKVNGIATVATCVFDEDDPKPSFLELPLQTEIGSSSMKWFTGSVVLTATVVVALPALANVVFFFIARRVLLAEKYNNGVVAIRSRTSSSPFSSSPPSASSSGKRNINKQQRKRRRTADADARQAEADAQGKKKNTLIASSQSLRNLRISGRVLVVCAAFSSGGIVQSSVTAMKFGTPRDSLLCVVGGLVPTFGVLGWLLFASYRACEGVRRFQRRRQRGLQRQLRRHLRGADGDNGEPSAASSSSSSDEEKDQESSCCASFTSFRAFLGASDDIQSDINAISKSSSKNTPTTPEGSDAEGAQQSEPEFMPQQTGSSKKVAADVSAILYVSCASAAIDCVRSVKYFAVWSVLLFDILVAVIVGIVSGRRSNTPEPCRMSAWILLCIAAVNASYHALVRPFRSKVDTTFAIIHSLILLGLACTAITALSESLSASGSEEGDDDDGDGGSPNSSSKSMELFAVLSLIQLVAFPAQAIFYGVFHTLHVHLKKKRKQQIARNRKTDGDDERDAAELLEAGGGNYGDDDDDGIRHRREHAIDDDDDDVVAAQDDEEEYYQDDGGSSGRPFEQPLLTLPAVQQRRR